MIAKFYSFNKRINSTKRPTGGTEKTISIKTPSSIEAPYITLSGAPSADFNYCYIPHYGRYYHIVSHDALTNTLTGYQLESDPLASFKTEILNAVTYVTRSASDPDLTQYDGTWTHNGVKNVSKTDINITGLSGISFILQTVSGAPSLGRGTSQYSLTLGAFQELVNKLFLADSYNFDVSNEIQTYFNPFQYVVGCKCFPFTIPGTSASSVKMGWYSYDVTDASLINNTGTTFTFSFTPGGTFENFTNRSAEWTRFNLYVPGFGDIQIDPVYYGVTLYGQIYVDYTTGEAVLTIRTGNGNNDPIIASASGVLGFNIQLSSLYADQMKIKEDQYRTGAGALLEGLSIGANIIGSLVSGNYGGTAAAIGAGVNAAHNYEMNKLQFKKDSNSPTLQSVGSTENSYFTFNCSTAVLTKTYYQPRPYAKDYLGGTCMANKTLGDLSGFTQCANGSIEVSGTASEKDMIRRYLEGGFYIE